MYSHLRSPNPSNLRLSMFGRLAHAYLCMFVTYQHCLGVSLMYCKQGWALFARRRPLGHTDGSVRGRRGYSLDGRGRYCGAPPGRASDLPTGTNMLKEVTILIPHVDCPWATVRHDTARVRDIPARVTAHVTPPPHAGEMLLNACSTYAL